MGQEMLDCAVAITSDITLSILTVSFGATKALTHWAELAEDFDQCLDQLLGVDHPRKYSFL
jgi:hypothetical protein